MRYFSFVSRLLFIIFISGLSVNAQSPKNTLENAEVLFKQYKLSESHKLYGDIAKDANYTDSIRAKAFEKLAEQDWKFYNNYSAAIKSLHEAKSLKAGKFDIELLLASVNLEAVKYKEAQSAAENSLMLAKNASEKISAGIVFAKVMHDQNFDRHAHNLTLNQQGLRKASLLLNQVLKKQPGNSDASELLVGISLLLKDGNGVLSAWKSYYLVNKEQNINQVLKSGYFKLKSKLVNWNGGPLSIGAMEMSVIGFEESKFFNYAAFLADEIRKRAPYTFYHSNALKDIVAYSTYVNDVKKINDKIYPEVARGKTNYENEYDSLMNYAALKSWNKLSFIKKEMKFDPDSFYDILNRKFSTEGYTGKTVNYYGMLMGHIIHKELKQINQYGYSTKFTYIQVDRLISRDFTSWYGTTNVGGWGDSTTIIQVRKAYMTEPFELLSWMTDPFEQKKILAEIAKRKQVDLEICEKDPLAEPKFLALYLKYKEASKIYKFLSDSGFTGTALNIGFIDEIFRLTVASTVFAHEGRHAIDQLYFPNEFKTMSDDERELRAKFSEVIYSLDPKMAFTGSIFGSDLDENTNHGKANKRFRKIIVDWMTTHESEISGLNKATPMLMQFDFLTDEQLIDICKSADPLAKTRRN